MKLLEYKSQELFYDYNIPSNKGLVIDSLEDLEDTLQDDEPVRGNDITAKIENYPVVVKAQVQTGGRGKAGGIQFAENAEEVKEISRNLLGSEIKGLEIKKLLVVDMIDVKKEWYLSVTLDRKSKTPLLIFSTEGGVDIEETAHQTPEKIAKIPINPMMGIKDYMIRYLVNYFNIDPKYLKPLYEIVKNLYTLFKEYDCLLTEINPLVIDGEGNLLAVDGKIDIDDNSLFRHDDILKFRDELTEDAKVIEAREYDFLYIPIRDEGNIGVISNGSGMIMSSIDLITKKGMEVSCALDLGGGATAERVKEAIKIVLENEDVELLLINIFGGITRCDEIARGLEMAADAVGDKKVIIRVEGTNKEAGLEIIHNMKDTVISVDSILEGVDALYEHFSG
ncbi:ADP-forming succinate--CoA ligase subunit beta [Halanaerobium sp. Z-7514]|uniref:ADP-forming succinate--CoA ligase subunit beta n=1 Tax=Halanaerobium polyolivorans TaxID=2886943 RepID=A0AAW4X1X2_9FIRM|nr:ADP-forming succinate--CoA ligase subunit beta [Halanaerobium polyolivorans]MCC3145816.1 ADP-forming succinate--CoA ligase subunit beta [Halanaerobium polyolivorans]RQD76614.1 MAG: ADP-forming succinate--CoA ligase subunit beta [Halanaerobium sp. MSAO_Bac5]